MRLSDMAHLKVFFIDAMAGIGEVADYRNIASKIIDVDGVSVKIATPEALFG